MPTSISGLSYANVKDGNVRIGSQCAGARTGRKHSSIPLSPTCKDSSAMGPSRLAWKPAASARRMDRIR